MPNDTASPTVPVGTLAKLFNLTDVRVQQLAKMGVVKKSARGTYDLWGSIKGYIGYLQERSGGQSGKGDESGYDKQRTRLYAARADAAEIFAARLKGTVHDGEVVAAVVNEMIANTRARLLSLPSVCAPKVADLADPNQCLDLLTDAVHEALEELAHYDADAVVAKQLKQPAPMQPLDDDEPEVSASESSDP